MEVMAWKSCLVFKRLYHILWLFRFMYAPFIMSFLSILYDWSRRIKQAFLHPSLRDLLLGDARPECSGLLYCLYWYCTPTRKTNPHFCLSLALSFSSPLSTVLMHIAEQAWLGAIPTHTCVHTHTLSTACHHIYILNWGVCVSVCVCVYAWYQCKAGKQNDVPFAIKALIAPAYIHRVFDIPLPVCVCFMTN